jgi:uncharacterized SAM-binding protein YcdF (DUF218 family)
MLKNETIICISSIDWDFIWQGHQEIMSSLAREGNTVLFIENTGVRNPKMEDMPRLWKRFLNWRKSIKGIHKERERLYVYSPLVLPFPYLKLAQFINKRILLKTIRRWMDSMNANSPIVWTFLPTALTLEAINNIPHKLLLYYCIDNFRASSSGAGKIAEIEERVIEKSDLVFVTSQELYNYCHQYNDNVYSFPFGVDLKNFEEARKRRRELPADLAGIKRPIVGYIGGIHKWIDIELLKRAIKSYPGISFVMVGPAQTDTAALEALPNLYLLGQKTKADLPYYIKEFDACIIPYKITEYTKNVYPTKLNEYLALGKRVISTALIEVESFAKEYPGIVNIAANDADFIRLIKEVCSGKDNKETMEKRLHAASQNTWELKIEVMSKLMGDKIIEKSLRMESKWKENMLQFYKHTKSKMQLFLLTLLAAYLIVFHTPLLWLAARPLQIDNAPTKADAIVVFAGGVGESGKAGQGYEERIVKAVELYKKGYANNIILCSGYKYELNETDVMKSICLSMGVTESNIFVENEGSNTYKYVLEVDKILKEKDYKSILLVSSPYNMRRAFLVWKGVDAGINVRCIPPNESRFYGDRKRVKPEHLVAIAHEYLGILDYYMRGYIKA